MILLPQAFRRLTHNSPAHGTGWSLGTAVYLSVPTALSRSHRTQRCVRAAWRALMPAAGALCETSAGCRTSACRRKGNAAAKRSVRKSGVVFCRVSAQSFTARGPSTGSRRGPRCQAAPRCGLGSRHFLRAPRRPGRDPVDDPKSGWKPAGLESVWVKGPPGREGLGRQERAASAREKVPLANRTGSCDVSQSKGLCRWNRRDTARRDDCTEETPTRTHAHAHTAQRRQPHKHTHPVTAARTRRVHGSPHFLSPSLGAQTGDGGRPSRGGSPVGTPLPRRQR